MSTGSIAVCRGGACTKRKKRHQALLDRLRPHDVRLVKCQDICKGPVVGVEIEGRWEWFRRMDTTKALDALDKLLSQGRVSKRLADHRVKKRRGKLRGRG